MWVAFAMQKLLTIFQQKISMYMYLQYFREKFEVTLADNFVKFWITVGIVLAFCFKKLGQWAANN